jgi:hypothetical protein
MDEPSAFAELIKTEKVKISDLTSAGLSTLEIAASYGSLQAVKWIIREFPEEVLKKDKNGGTALSFAVRNQHLDCIRELLQAGADAEDEKVKGAATGCFGAVIKTVLKRSGEVPGNWRDPRIGPPFYKIESAVASSRQFHCSLW